MLVKQIVVSGVLKFWGFASIKMVYKNGLLYNNGGLWMKVSIRSF